MNKQQIINNNKRKYLDWGFLDKQNAVKIHGSENKEHFMKKAEIFFDLKRAGKTFLTEAKLKGNKFIPDVLVIDQEPMIAIEIMNSESEESIEKKKQQYDGIVIKTIRL